MKPAKHSPSSLQRPRAPRSTRGLAPGGGLGTGGGLGPGAGGFTLAEVAVTILVVGMGLIAIMQALSSAKSQAAHTANMKLSRELGLYTIGRIEAGLYWDELEGMDSFDGDYAEEGFEQYTFEVLLGDDESFRPADDSGKFDSWSHERELEEEEEEEREREDDFDPDDEEIREPYERVQIRVLSPPIRGMNNDLILERWIPWDQVYGPEEVPEEEAGSEGAAPPGEGGSGR